MARLSALWSAPEINPVNRKAHSIPIFNPVDKYGRVFFFSWMGFFLAFWSWYAFPPLLSDVIAGDIHVSKNVVANSNVIALTATLLVRLVAGPACDRFGPRLTFACCLLAGAIPTFLAGTVKSAAGLYAIRFFVGILGGSFVPCQVWTTGFFDKNIIGTANSLTAGLGNAGGGITYFIMPAIYNSLHKRQGLSTHVAWRVSFVVPGIIITVCAIALVLCCPDTPTGKWSERLQAAENNLRTHDIEGRIVSIPNSGTATPTGIRSPSGSDADLENEKKFEKRQDSSFGRNEVQMGEQEMLDTARGEVIQKPSWREAVRVIFSASTMVTAACYFCSFGTELSVNSILGNYYKKNFPKMSLQDSGNYAAIFGILNAVARPLGGVVSDFAYRQTGTLWSKKILLHAYCVMTGIFCIIIGVTDSKSKSTLIGLVSGGLAFFMEGANGLNYSLVPHVHSYANGIVSGVTGASGNLGGIVFAIIFRYNGTNYARALWIIGIITIAVQVCVCWIRPVPKSQIGGR
ncbi:nitrate transporter [Myriangium duriaei CBS 260.36]|uniref:Nitrate/nitrite transporter n=1 Tax=Myriangium duriaei CBS 260.36 TaxID=1168546 RepID=A0A9P4J5K2_9PEZI|nr:nitrate transporter [Myriangium duriaei CBS 260.36]